MRSGLCDPSPPPPRPVPRPLLPVCFAPSFYIGSLNWCEEGAFDSHNLVQRRSRSPESLYGFHGNRLVQRTLCSAALEGGRETYSKIRLHKCDGAGPTPFGGKDRGTRKVLASEGRLLLSTRTQGILPPGPLTGRQPTPPWIFWAGSQASGDLSMPWFLSL